jgi:hypothetical protein
VVAMAAVATFAGCSGAEPPSGEPSFMVSSSTPDSTPDGTPSSPATPANSTRNPDSALSGIVVAHCMTGDNVELTGYDPDSKAATGKEVFAAAGYDLQRCTTHGAAPVFVGFRQQFDANLRRMAVTIKGADGGSHVGYIEPGGKLHDLTPDKTGSYGSEPADYEGPLFNPVTGKLWFANRTKGRLGWFDPAGGSPHFPTMGAPLTSYFFAANGRVVYGATYGPATPNGRAELYNTPDVGFRMDSPPDEMHAQGLGDRLRLTGRAMAPGCEPTGFIDNTTFLCIGDGTANSPFGIYKMAIRGRTVRQSSLLPASSTMWAKAVVVDPRHTTVAFLAEDRKVTKQFLYTVPLAGGEPTKITQLESMAYTDDLQLIAWK